MRLAAAAQSIVLASLLVGPVATVVADPEPPATLDPQAAELFEKRIRPVLTEHCFGCHSADAAKSKKLRGGLYLDTRAGVLQGGDNGPAIVPGKPAQSLLLNALRYEGDIHMPPQGKLPEAVISDFEKWIAMGALDPRGDSAMAPRPQVGLTLDEGRKFWAYKLPISSAIPPGSEHPVDAFVLAKLEALGLKPAPEAHRATIIRRIYYDLVGLPPSPEEVDAFVNSRDTDAYRVLVDKLLDSPQFGERWGRHWLDIVRYGESVTLRGFVFQEAWRYRDYVIDSFNADVPLDRFIQEQIAGDLLPAPTYEDRRRQLIATTFLQLGNTNFEDQDKKNLRMDVVDEQLDVIAKGFLAQTVTCARCHDHKFDPISTQDYYALAGILRNAKAMEHANVSKWIEVPLPADPATETALKKHESEVAALAGRITAAKNSARPRAASGVLAAKDVPGIVVDDAQAKRVGEWMSSTFNKTYIGDGYIHDKDEGKGEKTMTFQPAGVPPGRYEVRLAYSAGTNRASNVPVHVFSADGEKTVIVDMKKVPPTDGRFISLGAYQFEKDGLAYVMVSNEGTSGHVCPDAVVFRTLDEKDQTKGATPIAQNAVAEDDVSALEAELKRLIESGPKRDMVMSVSEEEVIEDAKVHIRGSVHSLGEVAPRGVLTVASFGTPPLIPKGESGRKQLAEWIASRDNPLTARVLANRVWHWLFGDGIVRTVDNFGTTGELPSNQELLDHLALELMESEWSTKQLVRYIVLSGTYRQSTTGDAGLVAADPENRLFGRANRRRLEAECLRDTLLAVSGQLDLTRGGSTFPTNLAADYGYQSNSLRRSVYLPQFRNAMPEMLSVFDCADPSTVTGRRNGSTVAPQALFMLNHPFILQQAELAARRLAAANCADNDERIQLAYRMTLGREPTSDERTVAAKFLKNTVEDKSWTALFHVLFASAEFRYVN